MKIGTILKVCVIIFCLMSALSYIIDCLVNFEYALKNAKYLFAYFIQYAIFRSWIIVVLVTLYFVIFKKFSEKKYIVFKISFAIIFSGLYAKYFYMDDYSLTIGSFKLWKLFYVGLFATIPVILFAEFRRKLKAEQLPNTLNK